MKWTHSQVVYIQHPWHFQLNTTMKGVIHCLNTSIWPEWHNPNSLNKNFKHQKHILWAEGQTWNEKDGESSSACRGEKEKRGGRGQVMEHSGTALPTCNRIFYYYGDFSVAPSFAQTVKKEREERDRAEGENVISSQEGKQRAKRIEMLIRKHLKPSDRKCALFRERT